MATLLAVVPATGVVFPWHEGVRHNLSVHNQGDDVKLLSIRRFTIISAIAGPHDLEGLCHPYACIPHRSVDQLVGRQVVAVERPNVDRHQCLHAVPQPAGDLAERHAGSQPGRGASVAAVVHPHRCPPHLPAGPVERPAPVRRRGPAPGPRPEQQVVRAKLPIVGPRPQEACQLGRDGHGAVAVLGSPGSSQSMSASTTSIAPHPSAGKRSARGRSMTTSDGRRPAK